jgi:hypothetical protein
MKAACCVLTGEGKTDGVKKERAESVEQNPQVMIGSGWGLCMSCEELVGESGFRKRVGWG